MVVIVLAAIMVPLLRQGGTGCGNVDVEGRYQRTSEVTDQVTSEAKNTSSIDMSNIQDIQCIQEL